MKRSPVVALLVAIVFVSVASAVPAHANPSVALGVANVAGKSLTYAYGQADLTPSLTAGVTYFSDQRLELSLWQGVEQGLYGEVEFSPGGDQLIEAGVWRYMPLSQSAGLTGWIGAQTELGGQGIWVKANVEASFTLSGPVTLFVGADTTLLKKESATSTWLGVGYSF